MVIECKKEDHNNKIQTLNEKRTENTYHFQHILLYLYAMLINDMPC